MELYDIELENVVVGSLISDAKAYDEAKDREWQGCGYHGGTLADDCTRLELYGGGHSEDMQSAFIQHHAAGGGTARPVSEAQDGGDGGAYQDPGC